MTSNLLSPAEAWQPLAPDAWNLEAARHLLRRAGWSAGPAEAERAAREGLGATLDRLFPAELPRLPKPRATELAEADLEAVAREIRGTTPADKRKIEHEARERQRTALLDLSLRWLQFSAAPEHAAAQKWVLFLSDVYVVSAEKVHAAPLLYDHFDLIARHGMGRAPSLTKAVSRSPAMVLYLDLQQNRREAPNENFARELFELFVLGEGNYSERDIKEAARAFTGYRLRPPEREFVFAPRQHDEGVKTVFGHSGRFRGDDVIDLAYGLPAAGTFLPHEWVKFYLSDAPLPSPYLATIGEAWRERAYDLRWLARTLFGSRLFFSPEYRGEFIKSPVQFYLGLLQDLNLDVLPIPRFVVNPLRQMGQMLFTPPNVRGWVGGRNWINSTSLAARRTLIEMLFTPIVADRLNHDEVAAIAAAQTEGASRFAATDDRIIPLLRDAAATASAKLAATLLPDLPDARFTATLAAYLGNAGEATERRRRLKRALITVLQSPEYQLC